MCRPFAFPGPVMPHTVKHCPRTQCGGFSCVAKLAILAVHGTVGNQAVPSFQPQCPTPLVADERCIMRFVRLFIVVAMLSFVGQNAYAQNPLVIDDFEGAAK